MGNQVRSLEARLGWLGGIIDGEGTITVELNRGGMRRRMKFGQLAPKITMWNTSLRLIEEYMSILDELDIAYYIKTQKPRKGNLGKKVCYRVEIHGIKRLHKALPLIEPYLISKRHKAEALYKFCDSRLSKPMGVYTEEEIKLANLTREAPFQTCAET